MGVHGHPRLDATTDRRNATTVCSHLFVVETLSKATIQTSDPMIPGHTTPVTRATMTTGAGVAVAVGAVVAVVGVVMKTARATMIAAVIAITTEDTVEDATTTAVAAMTTESTKAAHIIMEPRMAEYRLRF